MLLRRHPILYEINTCAWLDTLSRRYDRPVTLANVPDDVIEQLAGWHLDAVWMMGVWERSPRGREIALNHPELRRVYRRTLPGYTPDQILGSPYAVHRYQVDPRFGGREGLAAFREQLRAHGIRLILDYVPNHVAVDHPWTLECPECLIRGAEADLQAQPENYFSVAISSGKRRIYAHGRDPHFPAWTDTVQIDAFSEAARQRARETLLDIADQCDGVRCDMAMLLVNRIFAQTWKRAKAPKAEFWAEVIPPVRARHPDFLFIAEVYWDMEHELQLLGFDFTYDKKLYDRLRHETGHSIRDHLTAPVDYQERLVRFIENHDEARAITAFGTQKALTAALLVFTLPGMKLIHDGQIEGRRIRLPVQMAVAPDEPSSEVTMAFYRQLLDEIHRPVYHDGVYMLLAANPVPGSLKTDNPADLVAFAWALEDDWRVVVCNFSAHALQGRIMLPRPTFAGSGRWRFQDALDPDDSVIHAGNHLLSQGLHIELGAYTAKIIEVQPAQP